MPFTVAETIFDPTVVALSVPVATPLAFVVPAGWVTVFPEPVAESMTVAPGFGLPSPSRAVTVMVEALAPALAAIVPGRALSVDSEVETGPAVTSKLVLAAAPSGGEVAVSE
jgi:hypothetical protein